MAIVANKIYNLDCIEGMRQIKDNSIDLTITSPPYDDLRSYKGYSFDFDSVARELYRITKKGGVVVWVVGDATVDGSETGTSFKQALFFKEIGFNLHDTMIYHKRGLPNQTDKRYRQDFEFMFILSKGTPSTFNPLLHRKKYEDKRLKKNINRDKNGDFKETTMNPHNFTKNGNVFFYVAAEGVGQTDNIAYQHPATFPEQLAGDHIFTWSNHGDIIFDPFLGSGTTAKMAILHGRQFLGFEIAEEYFNIANIQINKAKGQGKISEWF